MCSLIGCAEDVLEGGLEGGLDVLDGILECEEEGFANV